MKKEKLTTVVEKLYQDRDLPTPEELKGALEEAEVLHKEAAMDENALSIKKKLDDAHEWMEQFKRRGEDHIKGSKEVYYLTIVKMFMVERLQARLEGRRTVHDLAPMLEFAIIIPTILCRELDLTLTRMEKELKQKSWNMSYEGMSVTIEEAE